jgi:hypothetical protein
MAATFNATPLPATGSGPAQALSRPAAASVGATTSAGGVDAAAAMTTHLAEADPHPQYETTAEVAGQIATHTGAADPHGDRAYAAAQDALHVAAADPHTQYVLKAGAKVVRVHVGDELTLLTAGTGKLTFRLPYAMALTAVRASLTTAQAAGAIFTVDINVGGSTILSTKLTIDNTEKTSTTAATPAVISTSSLADDAEVTIDIDQVGTPAATGLKVTLIGT